MIMEKFNNNNSDILKKVQEIYPFMRQCDIDMALSLANNKEFMEKYSLELLKLATFPRCVPVDDKRK